MRTFLLFLLTTVGLAAQVPRYEVMQIAVRDVPDPSGFGMMHLTQTNSLVVKQFEIVELVSVSSISGSLTVTTPTGRFNAFPGATTAYLPPLIVVGPANIVMEAVSGYALFKITPSYYPFEKASLVMPGPGGAVVTMECSTDLVNWVTATNGTYTNMPAAKFFRINLNKINVDLTPPVKAAP